MVSNASEDLPEPDSPVITTSWSRGISRSTDLRLCSRAPRMTIRSLAIAVYYTARLGRRGPSPATPCGSLYLIRLASGGGAPAPRRPAARTTSYGSPRAAGPQPRDALRLALPHTARLGRRGPSPATPCGSHYLIRLASGGGAPAPRRLAARTTSYGSPRAAGPQPRDALRLALPHTARLGRRGPSPATPCGSHYLIRLASGGGAPAPRRPAARTTSYGSPRAAGPQP